MNTKQDQLVFITLLVIFTLVGCAWSQGRLNAEIYPCRDKNAALAAFKMGERIELCCTVKSKECKITDSNDTLSLGLGGRGENVANTSRLNNCMIKLVIQNASAEDQGLYVCRKNGISMAVLYVWVVEKPKEPEIKNFIVSPQNSITVEFCLDYSDYDNTTVLVRDHLYKRDLKLECDANQRCHVCKYNEANALYQKPADQVTVIVKVFMYPHIVETKKNFSVMAHIRPGRLSELTVGNITSVEAVFRFCIEIYTSRLVSHMNSANASLKLHVQVERLQVIPQRLTVYLPARSQSQCMALRLLNLTAFTKYQVSVSGIGGGGEGVASATNFTSDKTVPANPPHSDKFSYKRTSYEDGQGNSKPVVVFYWEQLPHADQGGSSVKYIMKLQESQWEDVTSHLFHVVALKSREKPLTIKIWAENEIGRSKNYSQIFIPAEKDIMETPITYVEFNKMKARILLKTPRSHTDIEKVAIHWCQEQRHDSLYNLDVCQDYPKTDVDVLKDGYRITLTDEIVYEETKEKTYVQYYYISHLNDVLKNPKTASAISTLHPSKPESSSSKSNHQKRRSVKMNFVQAKSSALSREKLSKHLPSAELPSYSKISFDPYPIVTKPPSGGITSITASTGDHKVLKSYPNIFVSFYQNGNWSGMVRTRCNYDRTLNDVALTMRQNNSGSKVFLQWKQTCDTKPQQFLADFFQAYTSPDIDCTDNAVEVGNIIHNEIFSTSEAEIPVNKTFACVRAYREKSSYDENFKSKSFVRAIISPEGHNSAELTTVMIAASSVGAFVTVGLLILLFYCIRENLGRRKHFKNLIDKECLSSPSSLNSSCGSFKDSFKPDLPPRHGHSESKNPPRPTRAISTDSGRWTVSEKSDEKDEVQPCANVLSKTLGLTLVDHQKLTTSLLQCYGSTPASTAAIDTGMFQKCSMKIEMKDLGNDRTERDRNKFSSADNKSGTSKDEEGSNENQSCVDFEDNNEEELGDMLSQTEACRYLGITFDPAAVSSESETENENSSYEEPEDYNHGIYDKSGSNSSSLDVDQNEMSLDKDNVGLDYSVYHSVKQISSTSSTNIDLGNTEELDSQIPDITKTNFVKIKRPTKSNQDSHTQTSQSRECMGGLELFNAEKSVKDLKYKLAEDNEEEIVHASGYVKFICAHNTIESEDAVTQCGECKAGSELFSAEKSLKDLKDRPNDEREEEFLHSSGYAKFICAHENISSKKDGS